MKRFISMIGIALAAFVLTFSCARKPKEIKIGWIGPLTGDAAYYGEMVKNATELAVEEINQKAGLTGRK